ncbi:MAG: outer membrane protein assembly factor BamD, partial [Acidobacteriota bacterium]
MTFCAFAFGYPPGPAAAGDDAAKAYNRAYNLVLDEKWSDAVQAFQNVMKQHPNSAYTDDSNFWICFAKQKQKRLEESVKCYQSFIDQNPKSEWSDDAQQNMINVATSLAKAGMPQYEIYIKDMGKHGTDEVRLHAIRALIDSGDATPEDVIAIYKAEKDPRTRSNIVYMLTDLESPQ